MPALLLNLTRLTSIITIATRYSTEKIRMRSLAVRKYGKPSQYELLDLPIPAITNPDDVLIRVHAAAIMTGDTLIAGGLGRLFEKANFPLRIGLSGAGTISAVGGAVTDLKPGDAVYGAYFKHGIFPPPRPGFASDYAVCPAAFLIPKPAHLSFEEAAAIGNGQVVTATQCVRRYFELTGQPADSTLEGRTVFVTAALSNCGSIFVQVIKNVYGAERVVSTVSTAKVPLVERLLPGVVDQVVDYTTQDVLSEVGRGTVDLVLNTQKDMVGLFPLANPESGAVVSIASVPSGATVRKIMGTVKAPLLWLIISLVNVVHYWYTWKLKGTNVKQDFVSGNMGEREALERAGEWIAAGKIRAVMTVVNIDDIEAVRQKCDLVATGKGGLGTLVVRFV
ncbi:chaperonin 10-like protein [Lasiosphaeria hispida]|uniref:Chaperonin 10-like protein n=1 Tax=Lasiosphaeria hispida TaxID=260671 RepID=A0AAJ0HKK9_9PEZI|nr:chaperonin 10-like protein [Lasiosphaeria hispida]